MSEPFAEPPTTADVNDSPLDATQTQTQVADAEQTPATAAVPVADETEQQDEEMKKVQDPETPTKSTQRARDAYLRGDVEASRREHALRGSEPHLPSSSDYVRSIIFGGLDGIVTTFAIVAAAAGSNESWRVVLVFGLANAIADAWSMGFGEYISGTAEMDHAQTEYDREMWEVQNNIQGEIDEMVEIYQKKGFPEEDAKALVQIMSRDEKRFVEIMMVEELGLLVDLDDRWAPLKQGAVMFISFIIFGMFPLIAYMFGKGQGVDGIFGAACGVTGAGLLILGAAKGYLTGMAMAPTAVKMLFNGAISGGVSFAVGVLVTLAINGEVTVV